MPITARHRPNAILRRDRMNITRPVHDPDQGAAFVRAERRQQGKDSQPRVAEPYQRVRGRSCV